MIAIIVGCWRVLSNVNTTKKKKKILSLIPSTGPKLAFIVEIEAFLQEVSFEEYVDHPDVQQINYIDSSHNKHIKSAIFLRPILCKAIKKITDENSDQDCGLFLTSSSIDKARTEAMCNQLKVDGKTLSEFGFSAVPRDIVKNQNDVSAIRKWGKLDKLCLCIIVNTKSEHLVNICGSDHIALKETKDFKFKGQPPDFGKLALDIHFKKVRISSRIAERWHENEKRMFDRIFSATPKSHNLGVSLQFLQMFRQHYMDSNFRNQATTSDVCEIIIKKKFLKSDPSFSSMSFAEIVAQGKIPHLTSDMIGIATHFTSHAWSYKFDFTVNALENKYRSKRSNNIYNDDDDDDDEPYFWIDVFSVPQFLDTDVAYIPPSAWWATTFFHSIAARPKFVLIWYTWDNPSYCKRAWCLWEVYAALHAGRNVEDGTLFITMPDDQLQQYKEHLLFNDEHTVERLIQNMNSADSNAWPPLAEDMIKQQIRDHYFQLGSVKPIQGFDGLDAVIKDLMKRWITFSGRQICNEISMDKIETLEEAVQRGRLCHSIGYQSHKRTNYTDAEEQLKLAVSIRELWLGRNHKDTMKSIYRMGNVILKFDNRQNEAIEWYQKIRDNQSESNRILAEKATKMIAQAMMGKGNHKSAVSLLRKQLEKIHLELFGVGCDGADTASKIIKKVKQSKNPRLRELYHLEKLLGTGLRKLGKYEEAMKLHESMAPDWGNLDGKIHDNYLSAVEELAESLHSMGRTKEAKKKIEMVVKIRNREHGVKSRKTIHAIKLLQKFS
jgi:tetratricopeptide (TPR) repeat protein